MNVDMTAGDLYLHIGVIELLGLVPEKVRQAYSPIRIESIGDDALPCWKQLKATPSEPQTLCSKLVVHGDELPTDVTLCIADETLNRDGVDVKFVPPGETAWERIKKVKVAVNSRLFEQMYYGSMPIATCYDCGDHKITIKCGL